MKSILLISFLSLGLISHDWRPIVIDNSLDSLEVDITDWSYPWYVIKHETYFENTVGEGISEADTAHMIRNSHCNLSVTQDRIKNSSRLPFANSTWNKDTLTITIYQENASDNQELVMTIVGQQFDAEYDIAYFISPKQWKYEVKEASLTFSRKPKKGEDIKGKVDLEMIEIIEWPEWKSTKIDTIQKRIEGTFVIQG